MRNYKDRKESILRYHKSNKGRIARSNASQRYYHRQSSIARIFQVVMEKKFDSNYNIEPEQLMKAVKWHAAHRHSIGKMTDLQLCSAVLRAIRHLRIDGYFGN